MLKSKFNRGMSPEANLWCFSEIHIVVFNFQCMCACNGVEI